MTISRLIAISVLLSVLVTAACQGKGDHKGILVLAAASMTDALVEVGEVYEDETGIEVTFSFGGSNALARQVEFGAPADAVIFSGEPPMERLEGGSEPIVTGRINLLSNRLVLIGTEGTTPVDSLIELGYRNGRLALADPAFAPAGLYASQALRSADIWQDLEPRVIPTLDVRAAVAAVDSGASEFGLVYATDAANASGVQVLFVVPEEGHDPIVYPAALVGDPDNGNEPAEFLKFLQTDPSSEIFQRHGFQVATK